MVMPVSTQGINVMSLNLTLTALANLVNLGEIPPSITYLTMSSVVTQRAPTGNSDY